MLAIFVQAELRADARMCNREFAGPALTCVCICANHSVDLRSPACQPEEDCPDLQRAGGAVSFHFRSPALRRRAVFSGVRGAGVSGGASLPSAAAVCPVMNRANAS